MPLTQDELHARVALTTPPGTQRSYNARDAVGALFSAVADLAKFGHFVHVEDGAATAEPQEWPKMVYGEAGASRIVGSQEELDGLDGEWTGSPHGSDIIEPSAPHLQGRMGGGVAAGTGVTEGYAPQPGPDLAGSDASVPAASEAALTSDGHATHDEQGEGHQPGLPNPTQENQS